MAIILDGKKIRDQIQESLARQNQASGSKPGLAIVQVGNDPRSNAYISQKKKFGEAAGFVVMHIQCEENESQENVRAAIEKLNADASIHGILLQLPIPEHFNKDELIETIAPHKDVDGLTAASIKSVWTGKGFGFAPATAKGIVTLLKEYRITTEGKKVVVVGRSDLVGKPAALLLLRLNATVTICHSHTQNLADELQRADIIITATGQAQSITKDMVGNNQVIVDVGISVGKDGKLVGDVCFDEVKDKAFAITPVPGGVGPLTVASLFENVMEAYQHAAKNAQSVQ